MSIWSGDQLRDQAPDIDKVLIYATQITMNENDELAETATRYPVIIEYIDSRTTKYRTRVILERDPTDKLSTIFEGAERVP